MIATKLPSGMASYRCGLVKRIPEGMRGKHVMLNNSCGHLRNCTSAITAAQGERCDAL